MFGAQAYLESIKDKKIKFAKVRLELTDKAVNVGTVYFLIRTNIPPSMFEEVLLDGKLKIESIKSMKVIQYYTSAALSSNEINRAVFLNEKEKKSYLLV